MMGCLLPRIQMMGMMGMSRNDGGSGLKSGEDTSPNVVKNTYQNVGVSSTGPDTTGPSVQKGIPTVKNMRPVSYINVVSTEPGTTDGNGTDVVASKESVCIVNEWLCNTVYGFFFGKRVAYQ
ncbi:hypothetical protein Tco_1520220, partial [Tanacetum coccineum]